MERSQACKSNTVAKTSENALKVTTLYSYVKLVLLSFTFHLFLNFTYSKIHSLYFGSPKFQSMLIAFTDHYSSLPKWSQQWGNTNTQTRQPSQNVMGFFWPLHTKDQNIHWKEDNCVLVNILEISKGIVRLSCPRDFSYCPRDRNLYACSVKTLCLVLFESLFWWRTVKRWLGLLVTKICTTEIHIRELNFSASLMNSPMMKEYPTQLEKGYLQKPSEGISVMILDWKLVLCHYFL